ncbi:MAG: hypothetical protein IRY90_10555, partial [Actinomadura rubrobrunea]|nr:hypothetical protein [Actinomadura rubrobrunea]
TPGTFADFVDLVVPELRRRGRVPERYETATLRENLLGKGQTRLRDDHPGARFRRNRAEGPTAQAAQTRPPAEASVDRPERQRVGKAG